MSFLSDAQLTAALHDCLQIKGDNPTAKFWATIITAANNEAYYIILDALLQRGWSKTDIDQWDRGFEFQRDIGVWKCLTQGSAMAPTLYSGTALAQLDRREELKRVAVTINGVWKDATEIYGQPQTGPGSVIFPNQCWPNGSVGPWENYYYFP